jgi:hypothetical protein
LVIHGPDPVLASVMLGHFTDEQAATRWVAAKLDEPKRDVDVPMAGMDGDLGSLRSGCLCLAE